MPVFVCLCVCVFLPTPPPCKLGSGELVCKVHRVQFQPQCQRGGSQVASTPMPSLRSEGYLSYLRVDIGMSRLKFSPFSGVLHMSTPTINGTRVAEYSLLSTWLKIEKKCLTFILFFTNASSKQIQLNLQLWGKDSFILNKSSCNLEKSSLIWNKYCCWLIKNSRKGG